MAKTYTRSRSQRKRRGHNKKRTTVRSVYTAIKKYPQHAGASVREIHRLITRNDKGRSRRTLSSVKLAIARAVKSGSIRAPKGWPGFRGVRLDLNSRHQSSRPGQKLNKRNSKQGNKASRGRSASRNQSSSRRSGGTKSSGKARNLSRGSVRGFRSLSRGPRGRTPGARGRGRANNFRGRRGKQGLKKMKPRKPCTSNSNNSCPANSSDNYNSSETPEGASASLWPAYTCVIS